MTFHILENVHVNYMSAYLFLELGKRLLKTFCLETSTSALSQTVTGAQSVMIKPGI